ncbi:uncharacterized protein LOC119289522 [Triticum dicoccoides]|uniref:uncharacterized protein LOC119289522 n=1 Tax=Triticum dicoccoides TaxID=85692 RepID=UPI00188EAACA|nr:uncharacterized protein LOC119289522 [Triticum dicoccoides]
MLQEAEGIVEAIHGTPARCRPSTTFPIVYKTLAPLPQILIPSLAAPRSISPLPHSSSSPQRSQSQPLPRLCRPRGRRHPRVELGRPGASPPTPPSSTLLGWTGEALYARHRRRPRRVHLRPSSSIPAAPVHPRPPRPRPRARCLETAVEPVIAYFTFEGPVLSAEQPDVGVQEPDTTVDDDYYYSGGVYYYVSAADDDQE